MNIASSRRGVLFVGVVALIALAAPRLTLAQFLYFADVDIVNATADPNRNAIRVLDLSTNEVQTVISTGDGVRGLDVDPVAGKVYWTDVNNFVIRRAGLNGAGQVDLITSGLAFPSALRLDVAGGRFYWGDQTNEGIFRSNLENPAAEGSVTDVPFFRGVAFDHAGGKVYWTTSNTSTTGRIYRASDGGADTEIVITGLGKPGNLALDVAGNRIYWTDQIARVVRRAHLDGTDVQTLYTGNEFIGTPKGIALDLAAGKVYWGNDVYDFDSGGFMQGTILRMDLDGSNQEPLVTGLGSVNDLVLGPAAAPPCVADFNHANGITVQDIFDFLAAWFAGSPSADVNGGGLSVQDIFDFLSRWFAGC